MPEKTTEPGRKPAKKPKPEVVEQIPLSELHGIDEARDIESITIDDEVITDTERINTIFDNLINASSMGNDDYQNAVFKGMSEEEQQALSNELADSTMEIKIITTEGIVINHIRYYPTINYVFWALNYYKLDIPIK